ncbi:peptidylprolyl isomerase [Nitritalea halalkaliphila]|nr:peptidylprolyl isomerase [Nitritalea halalkaliphila]
MNSFYILLPAPFSKRLFIAFLLGLLFLCVVPFSSWAQDKKKDAYAEISTPLGTLLLTLYDETPQHKASFIALASAGYWDSLSFNRVIPNFVAQAGCPDTPQGFNDPEYLLDPEIKKGIGHVRGALGAGRDGNPAKRSARCQFYIVQAEDGLHRLDGDYTVFGHVLKGMEVVDQMVAVERDAQDEPLKPITLNVRILYLSEAELQTYLEKGE